MEEENRRRKRTSDKSELNSDIEVRHQLYSYEFRLAPTKPKEGRESCQQAHFKQILFAASSAELRAQLDRKSTRLNSSHWE